jgi:hypothetical protein
MLRPAPRSVRVICPRWKPGCEPRPPYMPPPLVFPRSTAPPDCGVKRRQLSLLEPLLGAFDGVEFPGRGTLLLKVRGVELLNVPGWPVARFVEPSRCAGVESENRRHHAPEASEVPGLAAFTLDPCAPVTLFCPTPDGPRTPGEGLANSEFGLVPSLREKPWFVPVPLR